MSLTFLSGPITNTLRTVVVSLALGWIIPYRSDTSRSGSAIIGKLGAWPWVSSMSLRPAHVGLERVDAQTDHLDAAAVERELEAGDLAELGRADGREVLRMGEEHAPAVAEPLVEADRCPSWSRR